MTEEQLQAEFPNADEVTLSVRDYGFDQGIGVRYGDKRHAVRVFDGDYDTAIATLRKWGAN